MERQDWKVKPELTVDGGFLVLLDLLVPADPTERRVKPAPQDPEGAEAPEESRVLLVIMVQLVLLASPVLPALMVSQGSKVRQESLV